MNELLELAERCEQATGPSAETDMRIAAALGGPPYHNLPTEFYPNTSAPRYTASLDAAMTLVPEGLHLTHSGEGRFLERGRFVASVEGWATERDDEGQEIFTTPLRRHGVAQTFALALCAAALRARAATPSSNTQEIEP